MLFRKRRTSVGDNAAFVTLLRAAQEDASVKNHLLAILRMPPFHRKSMLHTMIAEMALRSAPTDFVTAISSLLDDEVARKVLELLEAEEP